MHETTHEHICEQWYVLHCRIGWERHAAAALTQSLQLTIYLPELYLRQGRHQQVESLFPGYLFVQVDLLACSSRRICAVPGAITLVGYGDSPQPIAPDIISGLRQRLAELNAAGGRLEPRFQPGDRVRLTHGPLRDLEAVFLFSLHSTDRARVLIEFLGQLREADVACSLLEPASPLSDPPRRNERRTRGRGRVMAGSSKQVADSRQQVS